MIKSDSVFNNNFILPCCCLKDNIKGRLQVDNTVAVILSVAFDNTHDMQQEVVKRQVVTQFLRVQLYGNCGLIVRNRIPNFLIWAITFILSQLSIAN